MSRLDLPGAVGLPLQSKGWGAPAGDRVGVSTALGPPELWLPLLLPRGGATSGLFLPPRGRGGLC